MSPDIVSVAAASEVARWSRSRSAHITMTIAILLCYGKQTHRPTCSVKSEGIHTITSRRIIFKTIVHKWISKFLKQIVKHSGSQNLLWLFKSSEQSVNQSLIQRTSGASSTQFCSWISLNCSITHWNAAKMLWCSVNFERWTKALGLDDDVQRPVWYIDIPPKSYCLETAVLPLSYCSCIQTPGQWLRTLRSGSNSKRTY